MSDAGMRAKRNSVKETAIQLGLPGSQTATSQVKLSKRKRASRIALPPLGSAVDLITWVTDRAYTRREMKLFDDVGQAYELLLARMEFSALGDDLTQFAERTAYFEEVETHKTLHYYLSAVKGKGQIGHGNQYLTHWFYPYKGKYHGQMIKALINSMGVKKEGLVLDPFVGSGTTLVECATLGIPSIGIDINPALCIVSQIKVDSLSLNYPEISRWLSKVKPLDIFNYFFGQVREKRPWFLGFNQFNQDAKDLLAEAWKWHLPEGFVKEIPFEWRNFFFLCSLHALSDHTYLQGTNKDRPFTEFFIRDLNEYLDTIRGAYTVLHDRDVKIAQPKVLFGSALELPLPSESVDAIVTSPPYSIALDYIKNDQHLLDYLGIDTSELREQLVGLKGRKEEKLRLYEKDIRRSLTEMNRVLKSGCCAAIVLGDVVVESFRTNFCDKILSWAPELGFSEAEFIHRPILGGFARLRYEYIILLRK
jgi:hypothetical protein